MEPQKNSEAPSEVADLNLPPEVADLNTTEVLANGLTPLAKEDLANQEIGRSTPEYGEVPSSFEDGEPGWADIWGDQMFDEEEGW